MKGDDIMEDEYREKLALMRYAVIAPFVSRTPNYGTSMKSVFEDAASKEYTDPNGRKRRYSAATIEHWFYKYKNQGFDGLKTFPRKDKGSSRKIDSDIYEAIKYFKKQYPRIPATEIYRQLVSNGTIYKGDVSLSTVTRCVNQIVEEENLTVHEDMRRYERPHINEVWCGDTCVGPKINIDGTKKKIYVIALIDDASRFVTGAMVSWRDNSESLMKVMKSAVCKFGIPRLFNFDNGAMFKNMQIELLAARIGSVIHFDHPYSPVQKAKVERWFRTLRDGWLGITNLNDFKSLEEIQASLDNFVLKYNHTVHSSLNGKTPDDRFFSESELIKRLPADEADKDFLFEIERRVSADCVVTIDNVEYEVDCKYSKERIKLRYSGDMSTIFIVEKDGKLSPIRLLNKQENSKVKRNKVLLSGGDQ